MSEKLGFSSEEEREGAEFVAPRTGLALPSKEGAPENQGSLDSQPEPQTPIVEEVEKQAQDEAEKGEIDFGELSRILYNNTSNILREETELLATELKSEDVKSVVSMLHRSLSDVDQDFYSIIATDLSLQTLSPGSSDPVFVNDRIKTIKARIFSEVSVFLDQHLPEDPSQSKELINKIALETAALRKTMAPGSLDAKISIILGGAISKKHMEIINIERRNEKAKSQPSATEPQIAEGEISMATSQVESPDGNIAEVQPIKEAGEAGEAPPKLYRAITIKPEELSIQRLRQMLVPGRPNQEDPTKINDGNELGVYMSTNKDMVESGYSAGGSNTLIQTPAYLDGGMYHHFVELPGVGVVYEIDSKGLEARRPQIASHLEGVYNNGFEGDEWIANEVPGESYKVKILTLSRHANDPQAIKIPIEDDSDESLQQAIDVIQSKYNELRTNALSFRDELVAKSELRNSANR
jgi:hypothetical protein